MPDAADAAALRAQARRQRLLAVYEDGAVVAGFPEEEEEDWEAGGDQFEDEEIRFNDAGIPIEPFHLRAERAGGRFDPETGDYTTFKREEVDDAWVDALPGQR